MPLRSQARPFDKPFNTMHSEIVQRKVCGQELRLVLLCSSHENSGPKILAVKLPCERLRFRIAVPAHARPAPAERAIWPRMVLRARRSGAPGGLGPGWLRGENDSAPICADAAAKRRQPHAFHTRPGRCEPRIAAFRTSPNGALARLGTGKKYKTEIQNRNLESKSRLSTHLESAVPIIKQTKAKSHHAAGA